MITETVIYLIGFLIYILIQALVINGLKACTEGTFETRPDGKVIAKGMIFFKIAQYFNKHQIDKILYKGDDIKVVIDNCRDKYANSVPVCFIEGQISGIYLKIKKPDNQEQFMISQFKNKILKAEGIECGEVEEYNYIFYKNYEVYKFPKFIRKSVALSCIKCASSFWGTITFLPIIFYFGLTWWIGLAWAASLFSLVHLNYWIYKKL